MHIRFFLRVLCAPPCGLWAENEMKTPAHSYVPFSTLWKHVHCDGQRHVNPRLRRRNWSWITGLMNSTLKLTADSAVTLLTQELTFAANVSLLSKMQLAELVGKPPIYTKHVTVFSKNRDKNDNDTQRVHETDNTQEFTHVCHRRCSLPWISLFVIVLTTRYPINFVEHQYHPIKLK